MNGNDGFLRARRLNVSGDAKRQRARGATREGQLVPGRRRNRVSRELGASELS